MIVLGGCATWKAPGDATDGPLRARAVTESHRGVQVSAAVLGAEDSRRMLGADVTGSGVQPVWLEVRNATREQLWLLRSGADPDYFSPLEVAWSSHVTFGGKNNERIDEHFDHLAFQNPIPPGGVRSGLLFTNPQPLTKVLNVDLLGNATLVPFTLFLPVPGQERVEAHLIHRYDEHEIHRHDDLEGLRGAIEALPCLGSAGGESGDPVNMVLVGRFEDLAAAMTRRGYRGMDQARSAAGMLFGRPPDFVLGKRARAGGAAHWIRIWNAPVRYQEQSVFVGQAGRPVGGRFLRDDPAADALHPDVDEARNVLVQDLMYSGGLARMGFVACKGLATAPGEGGEHYTDGRRAALFFTTRPRDFSDVELLDWEPLDARLPQRPDQLSERVSTPR